MKMLYAIAILCFAAATTVVADDEQEKDEGKKKPPIRLDEKKKTIEVDGTIVLDQGALELLACAEGGKEYESVIALKGEPWQLHLNLLLLGLEPGGGPEYQGDPTRPYGDTVIVRAEWKQDGETIRKRAEKLVYNVNKDAPMQDVEWVFVGSKFMKDKEGEEYYAANRDRSIITVFHDPKTILDNPLKTGGDDTVYVVNKKLCPPEGTPVTLIIKPGTKPAEPEKEEDEKDEAEDNGDAKDSE